MFESEESCTHVMHIVFGKKCVLICIKKTQHYYVVLDKSRWNMNQTSVEGPLALVCMHFGSFLS